MASFMVTVRMNISPETYLTMCRRIDQLETQVTALLKLVGEKTTTRDPSIEGFCARHGISRSTYIRLRKSGCGPRETASGANRITITEDDERAWIAARDADISRAERTRGGALRHMADRAGV